MGSEPPFLAAVRASGSALLARGYVQSPVPRRVGLAAKRSVHAVKWPAAAVNCPAPPLRTFLRTHDDAESLPVQEGGPATTAQTRSSLALSGVAGPYTSGANVGSSMCLDVDKGSPDPKTKQLLGRGNVDLGGSQAIGGGPAAFGRGEVNAPKEVGLGKRGKKDQGPVRLRDVEGYTPRPGHHRPVNEIIIQARPMPKRLSGPRLRWARGLWLSASSAARW